MLLSYFKMALRTIRKNYTSTLIQSFGLATGLATFIFLSMFVNEELSFDRHHENLDDIYRVTMQTLNADGVLSQNWW